MQAVPAKYWDVKPNEKDGFAPMTIVKVQGTVQPYRERLQIKISRIRNVVSADEVKLTDFITTPTRGTKDGAVDDSGYSLSRKG
jgi:Predicted HD-superfamily hydrolase